MTQPQEMSWSQHSCVSGRQRDGADGAPGAATPRTFNLFGASLKRSRRRWMGSKTWGKKPCLKGRKVHRKAGFPSNFWDPPQVGGQVPCWVTQIIYLELITVINIVRRAKKKKKGTEGEINEGRFSFCVNQPDLWSRRWGKDEKLYRRENWQSFCAIQHFENKNLILPQTTRALLSGWTQQALQLNRLNSLI